MKKNLLSIWALLAGLCLLTACSDDDDEKDLPQAPLKLQKISGQCIAGAGLGTASASFTATYDKQGRLQTLLAQRGGGENVDALNDLIDLQRGVMTNVATGEETGTISFDAQGRIERIKVWMEEGTDRRLCTVRSFKYNADGYLASNTLYDTDTETPGYIVSYEYQNGTMNQITYATANSKGQWDETKEPVEYTQIPNRNNLFLLATTEICFYMNAGLMGKCPLVYLPVVESDEANPYQLDKQGNVMRRTVTFGTPDDPYYLRSEENFEYVGLN